jgi:hypothetical protein
MPLKHRLQHLTKIDIIGPQGQVKNFLAKEREVKTREQDDISAQAAQVSGG